MELTRCTLEFLSANMAAPSGLHCLQEHRSHSQGDRPEPSLEPTVQPPQGSAPGGTDSPAAIWILQPDSFWILVICSPPLPITERFKQDILFFTSQMLKPTDAGERGGGGYSLKPTILSGTLYSSVITLLKHTHNKTTTCVFLSINNHVHRSITLQEHHASH